MHSLTGRGRALLVLGLIGIGLGWGLRQPSLVATAVLLVVLPVLGALTVRRARVVLGSTRAVEPARLPFGEVGEVLLTIENGSRLPTGALLIEDALPESLGEPSRLVLDRIPSQAQRAVRYPIEGRVRGRTQVGPLSVIVTDPFGLAQVARTFRTTNPVLVSPRIVPLGGVGGRISAGGRGDTSHRSLAARGEDDLLPREHRAGDDMRRIHWRATARQGELMVRREEQAWHSSVTVILDDRADAHVGSGASSTFEWAVSAAASICLHYLEQGWSVLAVTSTGRVVVEARAASASERDLVLQAFAEVRPVAGPMATDLGIDADGTTAVIAVLARLSDDIARALSRPPAGFAGCLLLEPGPESLLRERGWRVVPWIRQTSVADAWTRLVPTPVGAGR